MSALPALLPNPIRTGVAMHRFRIHPRIVHSIAATCALLVCASTWAAEKGEFDGQCVEGLAQGKHVPTDCAITWADKDGKTYCFSDAKSKTLFLKDPVANLEKAREYLASSEVEATQAEMTDFTGDDVKKFTKDLIDSATAKNGGAFPFNDPVTGEKLEVLFDQFQFVRHLEGYGFFPDVTFHSKDEPAKKYVFDFWVKPRHGKLVLMDTRLYRAPKKEGDTWTLVSRSPTPWWWIPSSEHPGDTEVRRGWQVMSAIDEDILDQKAKNNGLFTVKDNVTGENISLEYVAIHQPVRKLKEDGSYFACSDFRKVGTKDQFYDIDFWINDKSGKMSVKDVRVHKIPVLMDGSWVQESRYSFSDKDFDVVP